MAIKGITTNIRPAFPVLGKLRKGAVKLESGPGKDLEYFRFASERPEVRQAFEAAYGKEPGTLRVFLPGRTIDDVFETWKEQWGAGSLKHRCDGETCVIWQDDQGKYHNTPKPCPGGCDEVGRLSMLLPEMIAAGFVGTVTLETHSVHDMIAIQSALQAVADARGNHPLGLQGIEFVLYRVPEKISTPSSNGRVRREKWLVKLVPSKDWVRQQLAAAQDAVPQIAAPARAMIDAPATYEVDEETGEVIGEQGSHGEATEEPTPSDIDALLCRRDVLRKASVRPTPAPITEKQRDTIIMLLQQATGKKNGDSDQDRHLLLEWLWEKQSITDLTFGRAKAMLDWLIDREQSQPGNYVVEPQAAEEARRMIQQRLRELGQNELPLFEEPEKAEPVAA